MPVLLQRLADGRLLRAGHDAAPPARHGLPAPFNGGRGDARSGIRPNVPAITEPSVPTSGPGSWMRLDSWIETGATDGVRAGVVLMPGEDPLRLAGHLDGLRAIAVEFTRLSDGRGFSTARLLRERLGWTGEIRATGRVHRDQMYMLARCGFTAFQLPPGEEAEGAKTGISDFDLAYQAANDALPIILAPEDSVLSAKIQNAERLLTAAVSRHGAGTIALASSLSAEDMVITDMIVRLGLPIHVFTLDTGRLHADTLGVIDQTRARYGLEIEVVGPKPEAVQNYVATQGANAFYESLQARKDCCFIRKVEPLNRALTGRAAWITGQRRDQSETRTVLDERENDEARGMVKYNPLADWSWDEVLEYAERFDVPLNPLYKRGYVSIGCDPCTRALKPGEHPRAARWWWEQADSKECGLHVSPLPGTVSAVPEAVG
jgi:phosphoadenosine phosphosulfate reductase